VPVQRSPWIRLEVERCVVCIAGSQGMPFGKFSPALAVGALLCYDGLPRKGHKKPKEMERTPAFTGAASALFAPFLVQQHTKLPAASALRSV
jgi:hypothetical protein